MLLLGCSLALATTDDLGGDAAEEVSTGMMKLVAVEVAEAAVVTGLEFAVSGTSVETVVLAVYHQDEGGYQLVDSLDAEEIAGGYATSGTVRWLLEPGETYALGAYVGEGFEDYYEEDASGAPWFGAVVEGYQVDAVVPEAFAGVGEATYFQMRVTSEDADFDADGVVSTLWGGTDCDDSDPDLVLATEEVPYDGVDQDCDGHDLDDVDGDGHVAIEAGGDDCNDTAAVISPTSIDICGDRLDSDCSGADATCGPEAAADVEADTGEGVGVSGGCAIPAPIPPIAAIGLLALVVTRRRSR